MLYLLCLTLVTLALQPALSLYNCSSLYERVPSESQTYECWCFAMSLLLPDTNLLPVYSDNDDLQVDCGVNVIKLEVNLCTVQWAGFDPTILALNGMHNNSQCNGTIDTSVNPPVIRYQLAVNDSQGNLCRQSLQVSTDLYFTHWVLMETWITCEFIMVKVVVWKNHVEIIMWKNHKWTWNNNMDCEKMLMSTVFFGAQIVNEVPSASGPFSQFSTIQSVIITSYIDTPTSSAGVVSYSTDLFYRFSCRYPLEYLINDTKIVA